MIMPEEMELTDEDKAGVEKLLSSLHKTIEIHRDEKYKGTKEELSSLEGEARERALASLVCLEIYSNDERHSLVAWLVAVNKFIESKSHAELLIRCHICLIEAKLKFLNDLRAGLMGDIQ